MTHSMPQGDAALRAAYHEYIGKYGKDRAVTAMATDFDCSTRTVYLHLDAAGIRAIREQVPKPAEDRLRAKVDAVTAEHGPRSVARLLGDEFGVTHVTIRKWMADYGIRASQPRSAKRPITEPCPCGAVAVSRFRGQDPALCSRCYMRTVAASTDTNTRRVTREYIYAVKRDSACTDCGGNFPTCCMHFDHVPERGQKLFNIGAATCGIEAVKAEIAKCDIVCANCHAIRTWIKRGKQGVAPDEDEGLLPVAGVESEIAVTADGLLF